MIKRYLESILYNECYLATTVYVCISSGFCEGTLMSNVSVACPGETVSFACTLPGTLLQWTVDPPTGSGLMRADSGVLLAGQLNETIPFGSTGFMFQAVLTDASGGNLTSTLTTITDVSLLSGSMVTCIGATQEGPLSIQIAGEL